MLTSAELIAHERSVEQIRAFVGADALIYQDLAEMKQTVKALNPSLRGFETSCFDGDYITGDIDDNQVAALDTADDDADDAQDTL
jgi:amidophosphoribosyltransferase